MMDVEVWLTVVALAGVAAVWIVILCRRAYVQC